MVDYLLSTCFAASFLTTFILTPMWIGAALRANLKGKDMNKYGKPEVAEFGGVTVVAGFMAGVLIYIGLSTFYFNQNANLIYILAALSTILGITIVGLLDDLLGWKAGFLKKWEKPLLTLPVALPMMVVNAGESSMILPIVGSINLGILYPLMVVPFGIMGGANGFNMLAGYNGLEAGMGAIILGTMGYVAWQTGNGWVAMLAVTAFFALLAFLIYNWYPAKIFPGDTLTYSIGALIACVAILGNMEKIAIILFIPYFLDFLLPLRKKLQVEAFAKVNEDNSLEMPYDGIYDVAHLGILIASKVKRKVFERDVVISILVLEIILAVFAISVF